MDVLAKFNPKAQADAPLREQLLADLFESETRQGVLRSPHPPFGAIWPRSAYAIVEPVIPSVTQSARPVRQEWKVTFAPQDAPVADPLTGWTGGSDPLQQVELHFPSRAAAQEYLERQGLSYRVHEPPRRRWTPAWLPKD